MVQKRVKTGQMLLNVAELGYCFDLYVSLLGTVQIKPSV